MATSILSRGICKSLLDPVSVTSDGSNGNFVDYNGYNRAVIGLQAGLVATGDSDDTVTFQIMRIDDVAASAADSDDHVAITAAAPVLGPSADTDTELDIEFVELDLVAHSMDNGCISLVATASEGGAVACSAFIYLYRASGAVSDTSMTITVPASS